MRAKCKGEAGGAKKEKKEYEGYEG